VAAWFRYDLAGHGFLHKRKDHFCTLGGFSKRDRLLMSILWAATVWSFWKERNGQIFKKKVDSMQTLFERLKFQKYWWLKSKHATFDFDYQFWRLNSPHCLMLVI
jgi:hypothetical protein